MDLKYNGEFFNLCLLQKLKNNNTLVFLSGVKSMINLPNLILSLGSINMKFIQKTSAHKK